METSKFGLLEPPDMRRASRCKDSASDALRVVKSLGFGCRWRHLPSGVWDYNYNIWNICYNPAFGNLWDICCWIVGLWPSSCGFNMSLSYTINIQLVGWCQIQNSYTKRGFGCADPLLPRRWSNDYPLRMGPIFGAEFSAHKTNEIKTLSNLIGLPCCVIVMSLYQKLFYSLRVAVRCTLAHLHIVLPRKNLQATHTPLRNLDLGCGPNYQRQDAAASSCPRRRHPGGASVCMNPVQKKSFCSEWCQSSTWICQFLDTP